MARLGLEPNWDCLFSNEWSEKKATAYRSNFEQANLHVCDVAQLLPSDLPGEPTLVWASFPCQDLSLAGNGAGLAGERSGTFRPFWRLMQRLIAQNRGPELIVLENVVGALTSHDGQDFREIVAAVHSEGYRVGALVIDAIRFIPQSRPRLFFVALRADAPIPLGFSSSVASEPWHTKSLRSAVEKLPKTLQHAWTWWNVPVPLAPVEHLSELIEDNPTGVEWHSLEETTHILGLMSQTHLEKLKSASKLPGRSVGTIYRRTRPNDDGTRSQRAEVRFDGISGCLRTPAGGSSRQTIVVVEGKRVRSRLLSPREAARLMGVPDSYRIPRSYNEAYHLFGDGLVVPVVRWLNSQLLLPLSLASRKAAA